MQSATITIITFKREKIIVPNVAVTDDIESAWQIVCAAMALNCPAGDAKLAQYDVDGEMAFAFTRAGHGIAWQFHRPVAFR